MLLYGRHSWPCGDVFLAIKMKRWLRGDPSSANYMAKAHGIVKADIAPASSWRRCHRGILRGCNILAALTSWADTQSWGQDRMRRRRAASISSCSALISFCNYDLRIYGSAFISLSLFRISRISSSSRKATMIRKIWSYDGWLVADREEMHRAQSRRYRPERNQYKVKCRRYLMMIHAINVATYLFEAANIWY